MTYFTIVVIKFTNFWTYLYLQYIIGIVFKEPPCFLTQSTLLRQEVTTECATGHSSVQRPATVSSKPGPSGVSSKAFAGVLTDAVLQSHCYCIRKCNKRSLRNSKCTYFNKVNVYFIKITDKKVDHLSVHRWCITCWPNAIAGGACSSYIGWS